VGRGATVRMRGRGVRGWREAEREVNDGRVEDLRDLLRVQEDRGCLRPTVTSAGLTRGYAGSPFPLVPFFDAQSTNHQAFGLRADLEAPYLQGSTHRVFPPASNDHHGRLYNHL